MSASEELSRLPLCPPLLPCHSCWPGRCDLQPSPAPPSFPWSCAHGDRHRCRRMEQTPCLVLGTSSEAGSSHVTPKATAPPVSVRQNRTSGILGPEDSGARISLGWAWHPQQILACSAPGLLPGPAQAGLMHLLDSPQVCLSQVRPQIPGLPWLSAKVPAHLHG